MFKCFLTAVLLYVLASPATAQRGTVGTLFQWPASLTRQLPPQPDEPLITDRPDFTEAASVVGLGVSQLEAGYTYTFNNDDGEQSISQSVPELLARVGILANWIELRIGWNPSDERVSGINVSVDDPLYLGIKLAMFPQDGIRPAVVVLPQMIIPLDPDNDDRAGVLPGVNLLYSWDLNEDFAFGASTQVNRDYDDETDSGYASWAQSASLAFALTDRWGGYTEYFGFYPDDADTVRPEHYFNGGTTVLISDDVQWDIRAGVGLNDAADDYFAGTGLSIRFQ